MKKQRCSLPQAWLLGVKKIKKKVWMVLAPRSPVDLCILSLNKPSCRRGIGYESASAIDKGFEILFCGLNSIDPKNKPNGPAGSKSNYTSQLSHVQSNKAAGVKQLKSPLWKLRLGAIFSFRHLRVFGLSNTLWINIVSATGDMKRKRTNLQRMSG